MVVLYVVLAPCVLLVIILSYYIVLIQNVATYLQYTDNCIHVKRGILLISCILVSQRFVKRNKRK